MREHKSLAHTRRDCKYHIVFIPKKRQKFIYGHVRTFLGEVYQVLFTRKGCKIEQRHLIKDHVHISLSVPP